jgi:hypothetical protein
VRAFGLYWSSIYGHVLTPAEQDLLVREAVLFVRHEDLCTAPHATIDRMLAHAKLDASSFRMVRARYASVLAEPRYYRATLEPAEAAALELTTKDVSARLGYA